MRRDESRVYGGRCDGCGRELGQWLSGPPANGGKPGIRMRCGECGDISFIPPESTDPSPNRPDWFVEDADRVVEWFEYGESGWYE
jgi:uncharacterized OB-fold protein